MSGWDASQKICGLGTFSGAILACGHPVAFVGGQRISSVTLRGGLRPSPCPWNSPWGLQTKETPGEGGVMWGGDCPPVAVAAWSMSGLAG